MTELIVRKAVPQIDWRGVPLGYVGKASAVCRSLQDCADLVKWFGDATFCPYLPVLVHAPAGWTAITGWGVADAAELQDCAVVLWNRQTEALMRNNGSLMNYDERRERAGLMRKEAVAEAMSDALDRKIAEHKASPVTNPFRQPKYPNPTNKKQFKPAKIEVSE